MSDENLTESCLSTILGIDIAAVTPNSKCVCSPLWQYIFETAGKEWIRKRNVQTSEKNQRANQWKYEIIALT